MTVEARLDVDAVRGRFSALQTPLAFFDGPGGTQVPDEVIDAIARYLRESNANVGGAVRDEPAHRGARRAGARRPPRRFLGCASDEVVFGPNMTTLNFALSRTAAASSARATRSSSRSSTTTRTSRRGSSWRTTSGLEVRFVEIRDDTTLDLDDLERQLSDRTRVVAFPVASNAVGTLTDVARIAELAHGAGALAWADAVHYAPHGPIDVAALGVDVLDLLALQVLRPAPRARVRPRGAARALAPVQGPPPADEPLGHRFETGHAAVRAAGRFRRGGRVHRVGRLGRDRGVRARARRALPRRAAGDACRCTACRRWTGACRRSRSTSTGCSPRGRPHGSASAASPSGTATTTRSR